MTTLGTAKAATNSDRARRASRRKVGWDGAGVEPDPAGDDPELPEGEPVVPPVESADPDAGEPAELAVSPSSTISPPLFLAVGVEVPELVVVMLGAISEVCRITNQVSPIKIRPPRIITSRRFWLEVQFLVEPNIKFIITK